VSKNGKNATAKTQIYDRFVAISRKQSEIRLRLLLKWQ